MRRSNDEVREIGSNKTMDYSKLALQGVLDITQKALEANGFNVIIAENGEDAKAKALALIPEGSEVFNATSVTLDAIGLAHELNESENTIQ